MISGAAKLIQTGWLIVLQALFTIIGYNFTYEKCRSSDNWIEVRLDIVLLFQMIGWVSFSKQSF